MKENSTEEDITRVKQRIEDVKEYIEYGLPYSEYLDLENSFDNILLAYKRVLKENEELKKFHIQDNKHLDFIMQHSIPVQKVKDKISERQFELQQEYKNFEDDAILIVLQELLEGRK